MIEIILLAGAIAVELEPYAVDNPEADEHIQEINVDASARPFQWTTRPERSDNSLPQASELDNFGNRVDSKAFGRQVENED